jgi:hypothetical protein
MRAPLLFQILIVLLLLLAASMQATAQSSSSNRSRIQALKPEPLWPFSEIEAWLLRGALIAASIPAIWIIFVMLRGAFRDRWQEKQRKNPPFSP